MIPPLRRLLALLALATATALGGGELRAQQPTPEDELQELLDDPSTFQFRRAWIERTQRIRARRAFLEAREGPQLSSIRLQRSGALLSGSDTVLTLGGLYSGESALHPASAYQDRLFAESPAGRYSVTALYEEMSRSLYSVSGVVPTWVELPEVASFYRPVDADDRYGEVGEFLRHTLDATDPGLDFGRFDNDGPDGIPNSGDDDGFVDVVAFLYQDPALSCGAGGLGIWPHRSRYDAWWSGQPYVTGDASANGGFIQVSDYFIQSGVECDGTSLMEVGTYAHELGHALALPDLYDTDDSNGDSEGIGHWGLMATGNFNTPAFPAHMSAWSKDFLGWLNIETVTASGPVDLEPVYQSGRVLRYDIPGTEEYFLLEHRNATGADAEIHGAGLLVWHVDSLTVAAGLPSNTVNADETRKGVDLEAADGFEDLDNEINRGDDGDPFPGSSGATAFGPGTDPNSDSYDIGASGFGLENIALSGDTVSFDVVLSEDPFLIADPVTMAVPVGESGADTVAVSAHDGSSIPVDAAVSQPWLSVAPASSSTPAEFVLTVDASALAAGPYADTLILTSPGAANSPKRVPVSVRVESGILALGDSVVGSLDAASEVDTLSIDLDVGDTVDVGVWGGPGELVQWDFYDPSGSQPAFPVGRRHTGPGPPRGGAVLGGFVVEETGVHEIRISSTAGTPSWVAKARLSGPVLVEVRNDASSPANFADFPVEEGTTLQTDTLWLYNPGNGSLSWSVTVDDAWISVGSGTGVIPAAPPAPVALPRGPVGRETEVTVLSDGRARPALQVYDAPDDGPAAAPPPDGAVPLPLTFDPTGFATDTWVGQLTFEVTNDDWDEPHVFSIQMRVHDDEVVVTEDRLPDDVRGLADHPDGDLVVVLGSNLVRVDPVTGTQTLWAGGIAGSASRGLEVDDAGNAYLLTGSSLVRVLPGGTLENLVSTVGTDLALVPDGSVWITSSSGVDRWTSGGGLQSVVGGTAYSGIAYHPDEDAVFAGEGSYSGSSSHTLRRFDPVTRVGTDVATDNTIAAPMDLKVGTSGNLYASHQYFDANLRVVDVDGNVVQEIYGPGYGFPWSGVAVTEDRAWVSTSYPYNTLYHLPVSDGPARPEPVVLANAWVGDASGSSGDTVGVSVFMDVSAAGEGLGDWSGTLAWDTAVARLVSVESADFQGTFTPDTVGADSGAVSLGGLNADPGSNTDTTEVARVLLELVDGEGGTTPLDLELTSVLGASGLVLDTAMVVTDGGLTLRTGLWGDANQDDTVAALDALVCLSAVVGKDVSMFDAAACDVAPDPQGGSTFDGTVSALDALAILSHVVGKALPPTFRVGESR